VQERDDAVSCVGVEACGRLIQEQKTRRCNELHTNATALSFSSRHTSYKLCTNLEDIYDLFNIFKGVVD